MIFEEEDMSPEAAAILSALFQSNIETASVACSEEQLARFASGWADEEEEERVLDALVVSSQLRTDLIRVRSSLNSTESRTEQVNGFLGHAIEVAMSAFASLERGIESWNADFEAALVVRHSMQELTHRTRASAPRLAFSRGANSLAVIEFNQTATKFSALVTDDGVLEVSGQLHSGETYGGKSIRLDIVDEVLGLIPLGTTRVENGAWSFQVTRFGPWDAGSLPATRFHLCLLEDEKPADPDMLVAQRSDGTFVSFPLGSPPMLQNGRLLLDLMIDDRFREQNRTQFLDLAFNAGPLSIPLSCWQVSGLPMDGKLSAPIPTSLEGPVPKAAIQLRLRNS